MNPLRPLSHAVRAKEILAVLARHSSADFRPHLFGYPAPGIGGYLLSAVLGLYVGWDIIRHGRHK